jgi:large subunit ribosomal protein L15
MPLIRRLPKRGFSNTQFRRLYHVVNVKALEAHCPDGADVTAHDLVEARVIRDASLPMKVLGEGELTKRLNVTAAKFSAQARAKIKAAGGTVHEVPVAKWTRTVSANAGAAVKARAE